MKIEELHAKYTSAELASFYGNAELCYKLFSPLLHNLHEDKIIYRERFVCIIKLENLIITPERLYAKAIPYLQILQFKESDQYLPNKPWTFGTTWDNIKLIENGLCAPYVTWCIWCEPDLVKEAEGLTLKKEFHKAIELLSF